MNEEDTLTLDDINKLVDKVKLMWPTKPLRAIVPVKCKKCGEEFVWWYGAAPQNTEGSVDGTKECDHEF